MISKQEEHFDGTQVTLPPKIITKEVTVTKRQVIFKEVPMSPAFGPDGTASSRQGIAVLPTLSHESPEGPRR